MEFEWDEAKAAANLKKHHIDFRDAARIFKDGRAIHQLDETMDYGEERFRAIGLVNAHVLVVIYAERDDRVRLISARRATKREAADYFG